MPTRKRHYARSGASAGQLEESHLHRLQDLGLIEWDVLAWRVTRLGQARYAVLAADTSLLQKIDLR